MGRSRENKAVSLRHTCGWRLHTNINCKTWWMVLRTGLIQNTTHGGPKTTGDHKFYMGFETGLFHSFQVSRGHISMLSSVATKPGNTEIFQSVTGILAVEVLALNTENLVIKPGIPCRGVLLFVSWMAPVSGKDTLFLGKKVT